MEARTNVHVNWIEVSPVAVTEKVNLALAGNELPDAFFKCAIDNDLQQRYGEDGVFVPLNDYLETYMPAFNATLNKYSDLRTSISMPDGTIYGVPYTNGIPSMGGGPNGWYNKKFFDALGMTEPKTLEEFYDAMVEIRDGDVNGNGEADEIPFLTDIKGAVEYIGFICIRMATFECLLRIWWRRA
jgi:putative aldouronate transport system substrate-binding protein